MLRATILLLFAGIFLIENHAVRAQKIINVKQIEKNITKLDDSLYVYRYEVSNAEYNIFLKNIAQSDSILYKHFTCDSTQWSTVLSYCEPATTLRYHRHPAFADYPVVNITYEAALEYCRWLTEVYNNDSKRKFKKVIFRLPDRKEWTLAAQGGNTGNEFPWGSFYMVNKKGFYMCNYRPVGDNYFVRDSMGNPSIVNYYAEPSHHSAEFPTEKVFYTMKVKSFFPNSFGIYNICGNAAEMTIIPGYAMGGSWNSYGGEIGTRSIKQYKYPSPEVGFRVFIKIIEQ